MIITLALGFGIVIGYCIGRVAQDTSKIRDEERASIFRLLKHGYEPKLNHSQTDFYWWQKAND